NGELTRQNKMPSVSFDRTKKRINNGEIPFRIERLRESLPLHEYPGFVPGRGFRDGLGLCDCLGFAACWGFALPPPLARVFFAGAISKGRVWTMICRCLKA